MCVILLSTAHPDYPLILISNRDEVLGRPTARAEWWKAPNEHVLGGRDQQRREQGTWLAITKQGRLAALTNFREEGVEVRKDKSRGGIVNAYVTPSPDSHESAREFARRLIEDVGIHDVGGFSLLFGELKAPAKDGRRPSLSIISNRTASADNLKHIASSSGETHGLSNSYFGDLSWPKVVHGEQFLKQAIAANVERGQTQDQLIESCFEILSIDTLPKRKGEPWDIFVRQMRNSILIPPVDGEAVETNGTDSLASASTNGTSAHGNAGVNVGSGSYGTQKQTVVLVDQTGKVTFVERTLYGEDGKPPMGADRLQRFEFTIEDWNS